ncbi:hypothetical protein H2202_002263 [Exophiala xenobiotica]|nr:hypothetical protein H2202_002263 [Exophiala xenobiotica]KAK5234849.1 hypothetical protein LTR47_004295 [Exophiala xenobiotica]KAK5253632.1 hypothetical protein LTS06_002064 [Exophiala xenobiotica]KAK5349496.1 hypothetical protein LTR61_006886 [Exophiala xenobiotica]KAK5373220.1 hypothetical protein LTR11_005960 [Exophiala xenobiotica]
MLGANDDGSKELEPSMTLNVAEDPYKWEGKPNGWRGWRMFSPGRGMYHDVRRRLPYYWSDIIDGFVYRILPATVRMYFVNLLPALAFQLDMHHNTDGFYGINEALLSSALAAVVFSLLSVQPITVVGITGLISLFNYTIFHIIQMHDVSIYPQFMVWVGIWSAIFHWLTALFNWCDYMRTVTDFSSETFALYVGTIYLIKGVEELSINFYDGAFLNGFASVVIAILFTLTIYGLEGIGSTTYFNGLVRTCLSDYAFPIATIFWTGFAHFPGNLAAVDFLELPITRAFYPTVDRPWVVEFWTISVKWVFVAAPFGFLMTLLFYYDHNVSSLTAQARAFPLKKPAGFHWDFFLLGWTCLVAGVLDIPLPNGLVPQAPVHTDALTNYVDEVKEIKEESGAVLVRKHTRAESVAEQRVSHFLMALGIIGTMTGPLLTVLHLMPRAIFSGVFFIVGWGSIESNGIVKKILFLLRERRFQQPDDPLLRVRKRAICHFIGWQLLGWACTVAISQTIAAIGFPVLIVALIPFRWKVMPRLFSRDELEIMDNMTATNEVVLVSLGGKPELPEVVMEKEKEARDEEVAITSTSEGGLPPPPPPELRRRPPPTERRDSQQEMRRAQRERLNSRFEIEQDRSYGVRRVRSGSVPR